jgi:glycosyltransferase 2 family protein
VKYKNILGMAFSLGLATWIVSSYDIGDVVKYLSSADISYLLALPLLLPVNYLLRAIRWQALFHADLKPRAGTLLRALMVGYMMNNLLPARAGDIARIYLLGRRASISKTTVLATVVIEKIGDLLITACLIAMVLIVLPASAWIRSGGYVLAGSSLVGCVVLVMVPVLGGRLQALLVRYLQFLPVGVYNRILGVVNNLISGIRDGIRPREIIFFAAYSLVIWTLEVVIMLLIARSMGIQLGFMPLLFVMLAIAVGTMIPSSPGFIGTFEYFSLKALALVSVTGPAALAFTLFYHGIVLLATTLGGLFFVLLPGREKIFELLKRNSATDHVN